MTWLLSFLLLIWLIIAYLKPKMIDNVLFIASLAVIVTMLFMLLFGFVMV